MMHEGEVLVGLELARNLVSSQFPAWAALPLKPLASTGTDHTLYRLGEELLVRFPKVDWAADQAENDQRWLPVLAPHLPVPVPSPVALGAPDDGIPWSWSVVPWMEGEVPGDVAVKFESFALDLAEFVAALAAIDHSDGPVKKDGERGGRLAALDEFVRQIITELGGRIDPHAVEASWAESLAAGEFVGKRVWVHADLLPGNLIVRDGRLASVIDFGALGVGDPAVDLIPAWAVLESESRAIFRRTLGYDDATWLRGRGWALAQALIALPYYWDSSPEIVHQSRRTLDAILRSA